MRCHSEVGKECIRLEVGEKVSIANVIPCGSCLAVWPDVRMPAMNRKAVGYEFDGGFEEYVLIPEICIESGNVINCRIMYPSTKAH